MLTDDQEEAAEPGEEIGDELPGSGPEREENAEPEPDDDADAGTEEEKEQ